MIQDMILFGLRTFNFKPLLFQIIQFESVITCFVESFLKWKNCFLYCMLLPAWLEKHGYHLRQGVLPGEAVGAIVPPPIPKVELNISKLIKLLTCKTNK